MTVLQFFQKRPARVVSSSPEIQWQALSVSRELPVLRVFVVKSSITFIKEYAHRYNITDILGPPRVAFSR